jgi:hypothetical protein
MTTIVHPAVDERGKWHAANPITGTAACGTPVLLDTSQSIHVDDPSTAHPIVCKRCVRSTPTQGDTTAMSTTTIRPRNHDRHVRWLAYQYALDRTEAEAEAQRRYVDMPHEIERWGGVAGVIEPRKRTTFQHPTTGVVCTLHKITHDRAGSLVHYTTPEGEHSSFAMPNHVTIIDVPGLTISADSRLRRYSQFRDRCVSCERGPGTLTSESHPSGPNLCRDCAGDRRRRGSSLTVLNALVADVER